MKKLLPIAFAATALSSGCGTLAEHERPPELRASSLAVRYHGPYQRPVLQTGTVSPSRLQAPDAPARTPQPGTVGVQRERTADSTPSTLAPPEVAVAERREEHRRAARRTEATTSRTQPRPDTQDARTRQSASTNAATTTRTEPSETRADVSGSAPPTLPINQPGDALAATGDHALDYVLAVYSLNGIDFESTSALQIVDVYRAVQNRGSIYHSARPVVGDLVFFHNTIDSDGDGRNNDWYSHVGIVESVGADGLITFLSYRRGQVARGSMSLNGAAGEEVSPRSNTRLREPRRGDPQYTQYLSGELFAAFGSILGDRAEFYVLDSWQPGASGYAVQDD